MAREAGMLDTMKRAAAAITDGLAAIGERLPGLASFTISAGGASVTVTPKPEQPPTCPACGRPR